MEADKYEHKVVIQSGLKSMRVFETDEGEVYVVTCGENKYKLVNGYLIEIR